MTSANGAAAVDDAHGVFKVDSPKGAHFVEFGASGLNTSGGYIIPDKTIPQLYGRRAIETFREMMDNDPIVGSIMLYFDMLIRQVEWEITPADPTEYGVAKAEEDDKPKPGPEPTPTLPKPKPTDPMSVLAEKIANHTMTCLGDMSISWEDVLSQILSMLGYGWSYFEIVYKRRLGDEPGKIKIGETPEGEDIMEELPRSKFDDGLVGWRKLAPRAQDTLDRWEFDRNGGIVGLWQAPPPDFIPRFIHINKSALFRTSSHKNSPEGRSILRNAYRPWHFKKRIEEIEAVGAERDLAGYPKGIVPAVWMSPQATLEQKAAVSAMETIVKNIKRDDNEGLVIGVQYDEFGNRLVDVELMSSSGKRNFDTDQIVSRYDQRIAMSMLADFILLGHEKVGSRSLGASKIDLMAMALKAWLDAIAEVFNVHVIPRLVRMNGWPVKLTPRLGHSNIEEIDLDSLGNFVAKLATAGFAWAMDPEVDAWLRQMAGAPEMQGAEQV